MRRKVDVPASSETEEPALQNSCEPAIPAEPDLPDYPLYAKWTDDCCGKKDFDGDVLTVSSRYWPAGGSAMTFDASAPEQGLHRFDDGSPCSAVSHLLLWYSLDGSRHYHELASATPNGTYLTGSSFEEVKAQVEEWANAAMARAVNALMKEFRGETNE